MTQENPSTPPLPPLASPKPWYKKLWVWVLILLIGPVVIAAYPITLPLLILWKFPGILKRRSVVAVIAFITLATIYPNSNPVSKRSPEVAGTEVFNEVNDANKADIFFINKILGTLKG